MPGPLHGDTWVRIVLVTPDGSRRETTETHVDSAPWEKSTTYIGWPSGTTITPYLIQNGIVIQTLPTMTVPECAAPAPVLSAPRPIAGSLRA